jgi:hypothetical protein
MTNLNYLFMLKRSFSTGKLFIRNKELPICLKCLHFIEHTNNYPYDSMPNDTKFGKCKKFGEIDFITGLIEYDFAKDCRNDKNKCGKIASEYMDKIKP